MKSLLLKTLFVFLLLIGGFYAKSAFAFTCMANATGNWNSAATWTDCNSTIPQVGDDVVATSTVAITLTVNVSTNLLKSLDLSGLTTGASTLAGTGNIGVTGLTGTTQNVIFGGTVTWTGLLNLNPATATSHINLTTNGKLLTTVLLNGNLANTVTLQDNLSFTAVKTNTLTINGATNLDMNGKTISGNSAINRLLITSNTLGTQRTITRNGGAFANADFRDIDLEASYDCSAITGLCGNAGGNSVDFTFTTATTTTVSGTSGFTWSTASWSVRVPLPQDDATFTNAFSTGQLVTIDMPRAGRTLDFTGITWTGTATTINSSGGNTLYGSFLLPSGTGTTNNPFTFEGRSSGMPVGGWQIQTGGRSTNGLNTIAAVGGTYKLLDAFNSSSSLVITNGTLDANDFNLTLSTFIGTGSATRAITAGNGTWTITGAGNAVNFSGATNLTFTAEGSTIVLSNTTATAKTFFGNNYTYNIITFSGDNITITGNNTIATLNMSNAGFTNGLKFTALSTTTITTLFTANATSTAARAIASSTTSSLAELKNSTGGNICLDYIDARAILFTGGGWYLGTNSTTTLGTVPSSGMTLTDCPAVASEPPRAWIKGEAVFKGDVIIK